MSNELRHGQTGSGDAGAAVPPEAPADPPRKATANPVPRTRTGAAWFGLCAVALLSVVLIVFMLQNTRTVRVDFLWMNGNVPIVLQRWEYLGKDDDLRIVDQLLQVPPSTP